MRVVRRNSSEEEKNIDRRERLVRHFTSVFHSFFVQSLLFVDRSSRFDGNEFVLFEFVRIQQRIGAHARDERGTKRTERFERIFRVEMSESGVFHISERRSIESEMFFEGCAGFRPDFQGDGRRMLIQAGEKRRGRWSHLRLSFAVDDDLKNKSSKRKRMNVQGPFFLFVCCIREKEKKKYERC